MQRKCKVISDGKQTRKLGTQETRKGQGQEAESKGSKRKSYAGGHWVGYLIYRGGGIGGCISQSQLV